MTDEKSKPKGLTDFALDPENSERVAHLLESYRELAESVGGAEEVITALSGSFAIMADPETRAQYDALRGELIAYLRGLDSDALSGGSPGPKAEFTKSPDVSSADITKFAEALSEKPKQSE